MGAPRFVGVGAGAGAEAGAGVVWGGEPAVCAARLRLKASSAAVARVFVFMRELRGVTMRAEARMRMIVTGGIVRAVTGVGEVKEIPRSGNDREK